MYLLFMYRSEIHEYCYKIQFDSKISGKPKTQTKNLKPKA